MSRRPGALRTAFALVAVVASLAAAGCAPAGPEGNPGISSEAATEQLSDLGYRSPGINMDRSYNGFQASTTTRISVRLDEMERVQDPAVVVDYLLRLGWSVNDREPNSSVVVFINGADENPSYDWWTPAQAAGLPLDPLMGPRFLTARSEDLVEAYGPWPGEVPDVDDSGLTP